MLETKEIVSNNLWVIGWMIVLGGLVVVGHRLLLLSYYNTNKQYDEADKSCRLLCHLVAVVLFGLLMLLYRLVII